MHRAHVLAVHGFRRNAESPWTSEDFAGRCFGVVSIFVVHVVFAGVNDRKLPELRNIHGFVEHSLTESALAKEADADSAIAKLFGGKRRTGCNRRAAADDCVGPEVSCSRIGNMHRSALAPAVAGLFAE